MKLYEIDQAILALVDPETGEIQDWDAFDALQMEREAKIENVACWYKNLKAEAAAIRQEEVNLAKRRQALEKQAEAKMKYLMHALDGQGFKTAKCAVSFRKTSSVNLFEPALAIAWALTHGHGDMVKQSAPTIGKDDLARLIKDGAEIPGCEMVSGVSMGVK